MNRELTTVESTRLAQSLREIREGIKGVEKSGQAIGAALCRVRDENLHRESHETFDEWCAENVQLSKSRCYQLMRYAEVVALGSSPKCAHVCTFAEGHLRPIAALPDDEKRREAILEAKRIADERQEPLAPNHFRAAAKMVAPPKVEKKPTATPEPALAPVPIANHDPYAVLNRLIDEASNLAFRIHDFDREHHDQVPITWRGALVDVMDVARKLERLVKARDAA